MIPSRKDRLTWHDHHMLLALVTAQKSPDPSTQVGACIVDSQNKIVGLGYNSVPRGVHPSTISWAREHKEPSMTKYPYIAHAEKNAIFNSSSSVEGGILYSTLHPCNNCAIDIIQAGIQEVHYLEDKYSGLWQTQVAKILFNQVDIRTHKHEWNSSSAALNTLKQITLLLPTPL